MSTGSAVSRGSGVSGRRRGPRWGLAVVHGASMEPTLSDGDVVLVRYAAAPRLGSVVVVRLPPRDDGTPRPIGIKRLGAPPADRVATPDRPDGPNQVWVLSDNSAVGTDSRRFGALAEDAVLGVVVVPGRGRLGRWWRRALSWVNAQTA